MQVSGTGCIGPDPRVRVVLAHESAEESFVDRTWATADAEGNWNADVAMPPITPGRYRLDLVCSIRSTLFFVYEAPMVVAVPQVLGEDAAFTG